MTGRAMYRYEVPINAAPHVIALTHTPVAVAAVQSWPAVEFWAEHDEGAWKSDRTFQVFGTGHPLPEDARWVGTCARSPEGLVWHLFEIGGAEERIAALEEKLATVADDAIRSHLEDSPHIYADGSTS